MRAKRDLVQKQSSTANTASNPVVELQRSIGSHAVQRLIDSQYIQTKLQVSSPEDESEQEADRVAGTAMRSPNAKAGDAQQPEERDEYKDKVVLTKSSGSPATEEKDEEKNKLVQAKSSGSPAAEEKDEEKDKLVQAKSSGSKADDTEAGSDVERKINSSKNSGSALPASVRTTLEPRFGASFSDVRVHTGSDAKELNRDVGAKAFTHGSDIYYGEGQDPANLQLTAHELTHVIQQGGAAPLQTESAASRSGHSIQRACSACEEELKTPSIQRTIGDGHDFLPASRFAGNVILEAVFDNEKVVDVNTNSTGAHVTLIQQALIALGYPLPRFGADSQFGDETKRAVNAFQRDVGLTPDGRVGFRTIDFLDKRDRGAEVAPPVRPVLANTPFNVNNATARPGATPSNALGPLDFGLTFPENVQVGLDVFSNGAVWQPVLTEVVGNYSMQTRLLPGINEVTGPGGNTNAGNYCAQINGLNSLVGPNWYMLAAVLAHERVHARQFRPALIHPSVIGPLEAALEAVTVPVGLFTPTAGIAELFIRMDPAFQAALNAAQANWLARILVLVAGDHNAGGRTDTEEHAIVDPMRRRICQHARTSGWPACPPLCP
jgi:peptidoglycan hydrolase-like protein with peptidoglycan-binding domain